jgi:DNA uptake protein ComE-like DNA-binding protein
MFTLNSMKKLSAFLTGYFLFSRSEQRGIIILVGIIICLTVVMILLPGHSDADPEEFRQFIREVAAFTDAIKKTEDSLRSDKLKRLAGNQPESVRQVVRPVAHAESEQSPVILELNSSDSADLVKLPGIGPVFARRIIKYRELLGGYITVGQLLEVYGMDTTRFEGIKQRVCVDPSTVKQLSLNRAEFRQFVRHPYFPYEVVKALGKYRDKHVRFDSVSEIGRVDGITQETFRRIAPYLVLD